MATQPVITVFVRHALDCPHRDKGESYKKCQCRKHLRWSLDGKQYREPTGSRSWAGAEDAKRLRLAKLTDDGAPVAPERRTIRALVASFVNSKQSQGLNGTLVKRYERELLRMAEFLEARGKCFPAQIDADSLYAFRDTWQELYPAPLTQQKAQERIRGFLRFLHDDGHIAKIPRLSPIKSSHKPRMPLDLEKQYPALLEAIPKAFTDTGLAQRMRAVVRLMRHSGLAIGDAVTLERTHLLHDPKANLYRIVTSRQKTGTHVSVIIPNDVAAELLAVLNGNPQYVFWGCRGGQKKTVAKDWQKDFRRLFVAAKLEDFSSHCLRDTFAVDLLSSGVPIEEVAKALGHSSTKTTEKYYAPWVKSRQERLDSFMLKLTQPSAPNTQPRQERPKHTRRPREAARR